eukprot:5833061-Prymnesium_polylepis.1
MDEKAAETMTMQWQEACTRVYGRRSKTEDVNDCRSQVKRLQKSGGGGWRRAVNSECVTVDARHVCHGKAGRGVEGWAGGAC